MRIVVFCALLTLVCSCTTSRARAKFSTDRGPVLTKRQLRIMTQDAKTAYRMRAYAECGPTYAEVGMPYEAAACFSMAGQVEQAFAQLWRDSMLHSPQALPEWLDSDPDFKAVHASEQWGEYFRTLQNALSENNAELRTLFRLDQDDRQNLSMLDPARDAARLARVKALVNEGAAKTSFDFYYAAMVAQHGDTAADFSLAQAWSKKAVDLDARNEEARWLMAASEDRKLMYERKPQKWGTQFTTSLEGGGEWQLYDVDPSVTDEQREEMNVPPLEEARAKVQRMNEKMKTRTK